MGKLLTILRVPELRSKVLMTFVFLFIYRLGFHIPLPGIDLSRVAEAANKADENALFGIMNAFTGAGVDAGVDTLPLGERGVVALHRGAKRHGP